MKKESGLPKWSENELGVLSFWENEQIFQKLKEKNKKTGKYYAFLDGPITANNEMKLHHVWNRSLKDIMLRYKAMNGYDAHFQNGFDAQGLWVEVEVEKELGLKDKRDIIKYGIDNFTESCIARVDRFAKKITKQSIRLGQWMDWDDSYFTNSDENITSIWYFLKTAHEKNWLIQKYRPMPWCAHCGTSLSEHELADSYSDMEHTAVFFKLPIKDSDLDMLVWTTTPWTLSSNVAIAVNTELTYAICKVKSSTRKIVVGKDAIKVLKDDLVEVEKEVKGSELIGKTYETCFEELEEQQFEHKIVEWSEVDSQEGSGAVHIAPGCGAEDFELGQKLGLKNVLPIDENGIFYSNFGFFSNKTTEEVTPLVFDELKGRGKLYYTHKYKHRYPICWRCKNPLVFRLTKEWYIKADEIRPKLISAVDTVEWQPEFMKKRMLDWLENMGDWNISRKRFYGLPLPFYRCEKCDHLTVIGSLDELKQHSSKEAVESLKRLHRPYIDDVKIKCPHCGEEVSRVTEVGDCWLDAGIAPFSTKKYFTDKEFFKKNFPVQTVIEMKEQIRLWFYSLLFMSVTLEEVAPYKKVVGFAMLVAEDGSKFSKSGPNSISFDELVEKTSADSLRYLFAANNMQNDTRFGYSVVDEIKRKLLGLWNAYIFFNTYAVIDEPKLDGYKVDVNSLHITDKWLIEETNELIANSKNYYENNQYFMLVKDFESYLDKLTNFYIRVNRRRFWKSDNETDKLNAYWALYSSLKNVCQVMAPITPFMSEYIWQNMVREIEKDAPESIFLKEYPNVLLELNDKSILNSVQTAMNVINIGQRLRAENNLKVKQPLSKIYIKGSISEQKAVTLLEDVIKDELNVKEVVLTNDETKFNVAYLTVNFGKAGRVLKNEVQTVKTLLENATETEMESYVKGYDEGTVLLPNFEPLDKELFERKLKAKVEYVIAVENDLTVVLDTVITEELKQEGMLREMIRQAQILRKDADFNIDDRIFANFVSNSDDLNKIIEKYADFIKQEVLIKEFNEGEFTVTIEREFEIDDYKLTIKMGK